MKLCTRGQLKILHSVAMWAQNELQVSNGRHFHSRGREQCSDCRSINVIHQSFNLREGVDRFKVVELKKSGIRGHCSAAYHTFARAP